MKKTPNITDEERSIFEEYTKGVKPLKPSAARENKPVPQKNPMPKIIIRQPEEERFRLEADDSTPFVQSQDSLQFARTGVQYRVKQQMRRGDIDISATLDLHGLNLDQAEEALSNFLARAVENESRYVLVIHGKAAYKEAPYPKLKNKVNQWLRAHSEVLAFCSANPYQGGVGAVYVLLRRAK